MERASKGEAEAFGRLVAHYEGPLFAFMLRFVGHREAARDICQDAFLRAFRGLPGFRVGAPFKPWLYRVAINAARSHHRRPARRETGMDDTPEPTASVDGSGVRAPPAADESLERRREQEAVQEALATLGEEDREVLVLRFVEDFSYEQMAEVLGIREASLRMRVHRGLQRLKDALESQARSRGGA